MNVYHLAHSRKQIKSLVMLRYEDSLNRQKFVSDNKNLQENKLKEKQSNLLRN